MYIYIYIYIYTYIYIYIYMYIFICIYMYIHNRDSLLMVSALHIHIYVYTHIYIHICIYPQWWQQSDTHMIDLEEKYQNYECVPSTKSGQWCEVSTSQLTSLVLLWSRTCWQITGKQVQRTPQNIRDKYVGQRSPNTYDRLLLQA
jgi:hypothetical protein